MMNLSNFPGSQFDGALVDHFIKGMKKEEEKNIDQFSLNLIEGKFKKQAA